MVPSVRAINPSLSATRTTSMDQFPRLLRFPIGQLTHSFGPQKSGHCSRYIQFGGAPFGGICVRYNGLYLSLFLAPLPRVLPMSSGGPVGKIRRYRLTTTSHHFALLGDVKVCIRLSNAALIIWFCGDFNMLAPDSYDRISAISPNLLTSVSSRLGSIYRRCTPPQRHYSSSI